MAQTTITTISTKGQVVIPKPLRKELRIREDDKFMVYGERGTIILKKIDSNVLKSKFRGLNERLTAEMKRRGLTRKDVASAIKSARREYA